MCQRQLAVFKRPRSLHSTKFLNAYNIWPSVIESEANLAEKLQRELADGRRPATGGNRSLKRPRLVVGYLETVLVPPKADGTEDCEKNGLEGESYTDHKLEMFMARMWLPQDFIST
jgi:hypothetical protein